MLRMLRNRCPFDQTRRVPITLLALVFLLAACSSRPDPKLLVGKWVNAHGYIIQYAADGTGHIPAADGIAAADFTYSFRDADHLAMNVSGQTMVVQVRIQDDKLTWLDPSSGTSFEYTRVK